MLNQVQGEIPICGTIDQKTLNKHDICSQCYIDDTNWIFEILRVIYERDEHPISVKTNNTIEKSHIKKKHLRLAKRKVWTNT